MANWIMAKRCIPHDDKMKIFKYVFFHRWLFDRVIVEPGFPKFPWRMATLIPLCHCDSLSYMQIASHKMCFFQVISMPTPVVAMVGDTSIAYCAEEWGEYKSGRMFFSIFSLLVQVIICHLQRNLF